MSQNAGSEVDLVPVFDAPDQVTAELVCSTLQAAGLHAVVQNQYVGPAAGMLPYLGITAGRGVLVPAAEAEAAQEILAAQTLTDEELAAAVESDPLSLDEAEAQVKESYS